MASALTPSYLHRGQKEVLSWRWRAWGIAHQPAEQVNQDFTFKERSEELEFTFTLTPVGQQKIINYPTSNPQSSAQSWDHETVPGLWAEVDRPVGRTRGMAIFQSVTFYRRYNEAPYDYHRKVFLRDKDG